MQGKRGGKKAKGKSKEGWKLSEKEGCKMRVKKAESTVQKMVEENDGKLLQKVETKRQKRAVQKGKNGEKWTAN